MLSHDKTALSNLSTLALVTQEKSNMSLLPFGLFYCQLMCEVIMWWTTMEECKSQ